MVGVPVLIVRFGVLVVRWISTTRYRLPLLVVEGRYWWWYALGNACAALRPRGLQNATVLRT